MTQARLTSAYLDLVRSRSGRARILAMAGLFTLAVAVADWRVVPALSLGFLYVLPMVATAPLLLRWQILGAAALGAALREVLGPFPLDSNTVPRVLVSFAAFAGAGLFVKELARNREMVLRHESERRARAEEQSWLLVESSLAAMLGVDAEGRLRLANQAAHDLFGFASGTLIGMPLPSLLTIPEVDPPARAGHIPRRLLEGTGHRANGTHFFAQVWTSAYRTEGGLRFTALVFDTSAERRGREEAGLRERLMQSRVVMGSIWHEVRNLASAMAMVHTALRPLPEGAQEGPLRALGSLLEGLRKLVSESAGAREAEPGSADAAEALRELRIIIQPALEELRIAATWDVCPGLPLVRADRHGLLEVFLNLSQNALHALKTASPRRLAVSAAPAGGGVLVRFADSGPGIPDPGHLFNPVPHGADATGLGLYVSRAIVRSFGGELRHVPSSAGACFEIQLQVAP